MTETVINAYLISDSSGETVVSVSRAAFAQFEKIEILEHIRPLIRSKSNVDNLMEEVKTQEGCIIIYTMLSAELRQYLKNKCELFNILCISAIARVVSEIGKFIGKEAITEGTPGKHRMLDKSYYNKIDVINFTMQHDDGNSRSDYNDADILLLGVSRTSKSPTSLYLSQRGFKVANLPIINGIPVEISHLDKPLFVGLTIDPKILNQIRTNRILSLNPSAAGNKHQESGYYTNMEKIYEELKYAKKIFQRYKIPVIDVSRKAIEEIAAEIINIAENLVFPKK